MHNNYWYLTVGRVQLYPNYNNGRWVEWRPSGTSRRTAVVSVLDPGTGAFLKESKPKYCVRGRLEFPDDRM